MTGAVVLLEKGTTSVPYSKAQNQQITMHEEYNLQPDNNVLSTVSSVTSHPSSMQFYWKNFH
jgi:hypothetical protein